MDECREPRSPRRSRRQGKGSAKVQPITPDTQVFEVDEYDTITLRGVPDPETNADLYPDIDSDSIAKGADAVRMIEGCSALIWRVQTLMEDEIDEVRHALDQMPAVGPSQALVQQRIDELSGQLEDWEGWLLALAPRQLAAVQEMVAAWLAEPIDWYRTDLPARAGAQGEALRFFEQLPLDDLEDLGVVLVYGDHPGSSYYAAELKIPLKKANAIAAEQGLDLRFVAPGEVVPGTEPRAVPAKAETPAPSAKASSIAPPASGSSGLAGFEPLFGRPPSIAWMNHVWVHDAVPVRELRHLHFTWLFQMAWRRIIDAIREPAHVRVDDGQRHVHILGVGVYSFNSNGVMSGRLWRPNARNEPELMVVPPAKLTIDATPRRWHWLELWQEAFEYEVMALASTERVTFSQEQVRAYAAWAFGIFRGRIRRGCDLRVMRQRIARELRLDPTALQVARQLCMVERRDLANMGQYNRALAHLAAHRKLLADAPRLQLTYALLCHGPEMREPLEADDDEPLQRIRRRLKLQGRSNRLWSLLREGGSAIWRPMARFYAVVDDGAAWDYLALVDLMGWQGVPDPAFMQLVLAQCGSADHRLPAYAHKYLREMRALKGIVRGFEALDAAGQKALLAELNPVLAWLGKEASTRACNSRRGLTWKTLVRLAREYESERLRLAELDPGPWPAVEVCAPANADATFEVILLNSAKALRDEGVAMRHCALSYARDCAAGDTAVGSVWDRRTGRRVASVLWARREGRWGMTELVGFANGPASAEVRGYVETLKLIGSQAPCDDSVSSTGSGHPSSGGGNQPCAR